MTKGFLKRLLIVSIICNIILGCLYYKEKTGNQIKLPETVENAKNYITEHIGDRTISDKEMEEKLNIIKNVILKQTEGKEQKAVVNDLYNYFKKHPIELTRYYPTIKEIADQISQNGDGVEIQEALKNLMLQIQQK